MSKFYQQEKSYRAYKALIASKYSGKSFSIEKTEAGKLNSEKFFGKLPAFESSNLNLFDDNAIAYYLSNSQLRGENEELQAQVIQWLSWSSNDFWPAVFAWALPASGLSNQKQCMEAAKNDVKNYLNMLNQFLLSRTFLVGQRVTLADISVFVTLLPLYQTVLDQAMKKQFGNVTRYYMTLAHQKEFSSVVECDKLCPKQGSGGDCKKQEKKPEPKKQQQQQQQPKQAKKPEPEDDDDLIPEQPKPKDPFEAFPKGNWNMDDFKRFYSNQDVDKSVPYFWEKFDKDNFSIWFCEYKYPDELTQVFMSCNLISGMFQRLDRMRKNAFASMILFGEDNNSTISGIWVWRGHELAFPLSDDWTVDYESYDWKKLDANDEKTKQLVKEYFSWEGDFDGKKFNQGKIFK